ncbi:RpiB/LacA/LacB family sugar-phosphate isomerase [Streptomyces sp. SID1121]|uniref:RpiB/LacA/LacB family sugar-phosphate isomerase n=1 Tax=Streptomyces sp. SID1121 TaxID=3425888 RepID=UPI0040565757
MSAGRLRLVVGSDRAGHAYKEVLAGDLLASDLVGEVTDVGVDAYGCTPYPEIALAAARLVAGGGADRALLVCHTGLGMAIAANKVSGIRAVTAHDPLSVRAGVLSNDAQVLTLGAGVIGLALARDLTGQWLTFRFDPASRAAAKVALIAASENALPTAHPHPASGQPVAHPRRPC